MFATLTRRILAASVGTVLLSTATVACTSAPKPKPDLVAAQAYLAAYGRADFPGAAAHTSSPATASAALRASFTGLGSAARPTFVLTGVTNRLKTSSTATYTASWTVPGVATKWAYQGTLPLIKSGKIWQVRWSAADVQPGLVEGQHLSLQRNQPTRAGLLDSAGLALFTEQPVVDVTIDPSKVTNLTTLAATLASVLKISAADIVSAVKATATGQAAPVITLRLAAYEAVKAQIYSLPGTQFAQRNALLAPTSGFAQPLLGQVGAATKQIVDDSKGTVQAGDTTGTSGLQLALNSTLAGAAGYSVIAINDNTGASAATLATLVAPVAGTPITLTLNRVDQIAADAALANVTLPASIVITQPSTGKVLAVANSSAADDDIALDGEYPPGSAFKIVTYTAAFTANKALSPATQANCPGTTTVNGQTIRNENSFSLGKVALSSAFAFSCNTTAANLGLGLPTGALVAAAQSLGLGAKWTLPVDSFSGSLPEPADQNELAADSYGQGKVLVSPLLMAEIAGAAAIGHAVAPSLVVGQQTSPGPAQPTTVTTYLNTIMRDVVTTPGATGRALATLPGVVEGKTGTAEFGTDVPPKSHSWFAGTRGDLALSVFVYGGESSVTGAVPLAKTLLTTIP
jgi:cell division protein FtsI/penicillin-binding protein 2